MTDDRLSLAFAALADPTRRDLVARLTIGGASVSELAAPYAMSLQAVSKHLTVLEGAGLVTRSKEGRRTLVHLEPARLAEITDWVDAHRRRAEDRMSRLAAVLAETAEAERRPTHRATRPDDPTTTTAPEGA